MGCSKMILVGSDSTLRVDMQLVGFDLILVKFNSILVGINLISIGIDFILVGSNLLSRIQHDSDTVFSDFSRV